MSSSERNTHGEVIYQTENITIIAGLIEHCTRLIINETAICPSASEIDMTTHRSLADRIDSHESVLVTALETSNDIFHRHPANMYSPQHRSELTELSERGTNIISFCLVSGCSVLRVFRECKHDHIQCGKLAPDADAAEKFNHRCPVAVCVPPIPMSE